MSRNTRPSISPLFNAEHALKFAPSPRIDLAKVKVTSRILPSDWQSKLIGLCWSDDLPLQPFEIFRNAISDFKEKDTVIDQLQFIYHRLIGNLDDKLDSLSTKKYKEIIIKLRNAFYDAIQPASSPTEKATQEESFYQRISSIVSLIWCDKLERELCRFNPTLHAPLEKHRGDASTYTARDELARGLQLICQRLVGYLDAPDQLGELSQSEKEAILSKITEEVNECPAGFHCRVNGVVMAMQIPQTLSQLLCKVRQSLVENVGAALTSGVHTENRVTVVAKNLGYGTEARLESDVLVDGEMRPLPDDTILSALSKKFDSEFRPMVLPFLLCDELRGILTNVGYTGRKENGYTLDDYTRMANFIDNFLGLKDRPQAAGSPPWYIQYFIVDPETDDVNDINWPLLRRLFLDILVKNKYLKKMPSLGVTPIAETLVDCFYENELTREIKTQAELDRSIHPIVNLFDDMLKFIDGSEYVMSIYLLIFEKIKSISPILFMQIIKKRKVIDAMFDVITQFYENRVDTATVNTIPDNSDIFRLADLFTVPPRRNPFLAVLEEKLLRVNVVNRKDMAKIIAFFIKNNRTPVADKPFMSPAIKKFLKAHEILISGKNFEKKLIEFLNEIPQPYWKTIINFLYPKDFYVVLAIDFKLNKVTENRHELLISHQQKLLKIYSFLCQNKPDAKKLISLITEYYSDPSNAAHFSTALPQLFYISCIKDSFDETESYFVKRIQDAVVKKYEEKEKAREFQKDFMGLSVTELHIDLFDWFLMAAGKRKNHVMRLALLDFLKDTHCTKLFLANALHYHDRIQKILEIAIRFSHEARMDFCAAIAAHLQVVSRSPIEMSSTFFAQLLLLLMQLCTQEVTGALLLFDSIFEFMIKNQDLFLPNLPTFLRDENFSNAFLNMLVLKFSESDSRKYSQFLANMKPIIDFNVFYGHTSIFIFIVKLMGRLKTQQFIAVVDMISDESLKRKFLTIIINQLVLSTKDNLIMILLAKIALTIDVNVLSTIDNSRGELFAEATHLVNAIKVANSVETIRTELSANMEQNPSTASGSTFFRIFSSARSKYVTCLHECLAIVNSYKPPISPMPMAVVPPPRN